MKQLSFKTPVQNVSTSVLSFLNPGIDISICLMASIFFFIILPSASVNASPLTDAIRDGDYGLVKSLIDQGTPVDQVDNNRTPTALISVIMKNDSNIAEFLISQGANVNAAHPATQCSALQLAAGSFNNKTALSIVKLLVENGANINMNGSYCGPPIMEASIAGHLEVVQYLHQKNADINLQKNTSYALYESVINKHDDIAQWLLENGANPNLVTRDGSTAILIIAQYMPDLFLIALKNGGKLSLDKQNRGALGYAITGGDFEVIKLLINSKPPQEELDEALRTATTLQKDDLVDALISKGADPGARNQWGDSANSISEMIPKAPAEK